MKDINEMTLKDFGGLIDYLENKEKSKEGKFRPLSEHQKLMINRAKEANE